MRKFKRFAPHRLRFRLLFILAAAALLLTAFVPNANADELVYFNFEDAVVGGPPDFEADVVGAPDFNPGGGIQLSTMTTNFLFDAAVDGFLDNRTTLDIDNADPGVGLGLRTTPDDNGHWIQFPVNATTFHDMSLSFAVNTAGNGFNTVELSYSTTGPGGPFIVVGSQFIPSSGVQVLTFSVPTGANFQANLVLRLTWSGGTSEGNNLQTVVDNIQLTGVPEPTTVVGGLLGVLGLCWHHRRRLIRHMRFRRTSG
jgi:hypothetical protein